MTNNLSRTSSSVSTVPDSRTVADLVIETLAGSEAELLERVASLEADVAVYRLLAAAAFDVLQILTAQHQAHEASCDRLRDEYRALCEQTFLKAAADDGEAA
jgi:hypothetical protein